MASPYESVSSVKLSMSSNWFCLLPNFNFEVYRRDRMASPYESVSSVKLSMSSNWFCLLPNFNFDSLTHFLDLSVNEMVVILPPSGLLTSVKILTSQAVVSIVLT